MKKFRRSLTLLIVTALALSLSAQVASGANPPAPSNISITYSPPAPGEISPGATLTWRSPNAADAVIIGYRVAARFINSDDVRGANSNRWQPDDRWSEIVSPAIAQQTLLNKYSLFPDSSAVIPVGSGYGLEDGQTLQWRVGAVSEEPVAERKPGVSNLCVLRTSGLVECSGIFNSSTAGGVDVGQDPYLREVGNTISYDYRPVDGISPLGRVGLVSKLELGHEMACVISRTSKLSNFGVSVFPSVG